MSKSKKKNKTRSKKKKITKGKELLSSSKTQKRPIKKEVSKTSKKTKNDTKKIEQKKEVEKFETKKTKNTKTLLMFLIIAIIICAIVYTYNYIYDNYTNTVNYTFKTNLVNTKAQFSSSEKDLDLITEGIKDSTITINHYYDQITILNNDIEEKISNNDTFFKYYGENDIILISGNKYILDYVFFTPFEDQKITFETDNDSIKLSNNVITAKDNGEATIYACYGDKRIELIKILSTNLITERPEEFDDKRDFLSCEQYSNEENELLDKILAKKIDDVGYQTRAGAVEALRFLSLDLPYRVNYFNENGRLPYTDAQGRYYHKGLYLSSGKYDEIQEKDKKYIGTWGCRIYSNPLEAKQANGLDCSGLIGWALYNAGYDPDDIRGADLLMDLGETLTSKKAVESGRIKVGDFVHNEEAESHIGMIVGIDDDNNYYVCQSIWYKPNGVCISKYTKNQFIKHWLHVSLLDDYYGKDGNLTNMWY